DGDHIDDADDRGVHRRCLFSERLAGRAAFDHDEHFLVDARADAVDGEDRRAARRVVGVERLHEHQLGALELAMLLRRNDGSDVSDHERDLHQSRSSFASTHRAISNFRSNTEAELIPTVDSNEDRDQSLTSTVSMMPTMTASTGQSFMPDAIRAELPLTTSTVS